MVQLRGVRIGNHYYLFSGKEFHEKISVDKDYPFIELKGRKALKYKERIVLDQEELQELRRLAMNITREKIVSSDPWEELVSSITSLIDELDKAFNSVTQRIRRIVSIYYPEAAIKMENQELVEKLGRLEQEELTPSTEMPAAIKELRDVLLLKKKREELLGLLEKVLQEKSPNLYGICGAMLAARLLRQAGSLKSLARMPASTIQVLGAEKALFRHLTKKTKPPKHGFIGSHPLLQGVNKKAKGKLARILAEKISLAARTDYYTKRIIYPELLRAIEKKREEVIRLASKKKQ